MEKADQTLAVPVDHQQIDAVLTRYRDALTRTKDGWRLKLRKLPMVKATRFEDAANLLREKLQRLFRRENRQIDRLEEGASEIQG